jgi:Ca-activated chloride channel family protein
MLPALQRALKAKHDPRYLQMYVFLTDGFVGNEDEILRVIKEEKGEARFFAFGIGSSVNRYLVEGIGNIGNGLSCVVLPRDENHAEKAAAWFFRSIDAPVLTDIQIDWQLLPVEKAYPQKVKDLFAGQAIEIIGKYNAPFSGSISISGRSGMEQVQFSIPVVFPTEEKGNRSLALLYARQRIQELSESYISAEKEKQEKIAGQITELSVKTGLVTQFTSFIAVDESRIVSNGRPLKIVQPLAKAEGSFGGNSAQAFRVDKWGMILSGDKNGVHINAVDDQGTAARSGVPTGGKIKRINRTGVYDLEQLEGLLLQAGGDVIEVELESGRKFLLPLP